jgi:hypothetical protein
MTTLIYNNVVLRDCELLGFHQTLKYDESDTDVMYSVFRISVASSIVAVRNYSQPRDAFGVDTPLGFTAPQKLHDVHARLSESRKDFWLLMDNCVDHELDGLGVTANVLDQPLLIATGDAYDYVKELYTENGEVRERIVKTAKFMVKHPFSLNASTDYYGPGDGLLDKSTVLDCDNGPRPLNVKVERIIGGRSIRIQFEIEVCRKICAIGFTDEEPIVSGTIEGSDGLVLSNRWHIDESKDENWVTTRSLQGTLRVANKEIWPHAMRYLCVPSLLRGYQRVAQSFVDDPTGLTLKYRVDDRQAHAAPPYPAIKWSGHHSETASGANGTIKGGEFSIRLQGPPGVDKQQLIGAAGKLAVNRIQGLAIVRNNDQQIENYSTVLKNVAVMDAIDQPVIELRIQVTYADDSYKQLGLRLKKIGESIGTVSGSAADNPYLIDGYDPEVWPVPLAYDSPSPAGIFSCYLQHPCSVWHDVPNEMTVPADGTQPPVTERPKSDESKRKEPGTGSPNDGYRYGTFDFVENIFNVDQRLPDDVDDLRRGYQYVDLYKYPYSYVEIQNSYTIRQGFAQLPLSTAEPVQTQAGYSPSAAIVQVHAPTAKRVLTMVATRDGKPPVIPSLREDGVDHNGIREVLGDVEITTKAPELMATGQGRRYAVQLRYEYLLDRAPTAAEKLRTGSMPWDIFPAAKNWMDLAQFVDTTSHLQT